MKLNRQNYEEWMFNLLEGEVEEPLRSELLKQIEEDEFYRGEWKLWQATRLTPPPFAYQNSEALKKKAFILPYFLRYAAAACVVFGAVYFALKYTGNEPEKTFVSTPANDLPKTLNHIKASEDSTDIVGDESVENAKDEVKPVFVDAIALDPVKTKKLTQLSDTQLTKVHVPVKNEREVMIADERKIFEEAPVLQSNKKMEGAHSNTPMAALNKESGVEMKITVEKPVVMDRGDDERKPFLRRLFSSPSVKVARDTAYKIPFKLVLENEEYVVIAAY